MGTIIPKLTLNKTPYITQNNSLIFSKNIRADIDGTIHKDYGLKSIIENDSILTEYITNRGYYICGIIPSNSEFYIFIHNGLSNNAHIIKYDELNNTSTLCDTAWSYNGGEINGNVIKNLVGDTLLIIGESNARKDIPIKTINLTYSKNTDDESIYTQTPNIPITNLNYKTTYQCSIPNGTYQFFIRYRIRENFYTNWIPVSKDLYATNINTEDTNFGTVSYNNINTNSDFSFVFEVSHLIKDNIKNYKDFQVGFLLSHDDEIIARAWKHFNFNITTIYFNYESTDIKEINTWDLFNTTYQLYNVGNITSFKNKIYVSNYKETNFNPNLTSYAKNIVINIKEASIKTNNTNIDVEEFKFNYNDVDTVNIPKEFYNYVKYQTVDSTKYITDIFIKDKLYSVKTIMQELYDIHLKKLKDALSGTLDITKGAIENNKYGFKIRSNFTSDIIIENILYNALMSNSYEINDKYTSAIYTPVRCISEYKEYEFQNGVGGKATMKIKESKEDIIKNLTLHGFANCYQKDSSGNYQHVVGLNKIIYDVNDLNNYVLESIEYITLDRTSFINGKQTVSCKLYYKDDDTALYTHKIDMIQISLTIYFKFTSNWSIIDKERNENITFTIGNINSAISVLNELEDIVDVEQGISTTEEIISYTNSQTLIPHQEYNFYVHYVKETNEITNGYLCGTKKIDHKANCDVIIYPEFTNITIPNGYKACFFSITHINERVATVFNINDQDLGSCAELNMGLLPYNKDINCAHSSGTINGKYHYSADTSVSKYFGCDGIIKLENSTHNKKLLYIVDKFSKNLPEIKDLYKCTPYITTSSYGDYTQMSLLGFICSYNPLERERCLNYYSDGNEVYYKLSSNQSQNIENNIINFRELSKYSDGEYKIKDFGITFSRSFLIYSSFNLNCVSLNEDIKNVIKTYYDYSSESYTDKHSDDEKHNIMWKLFTSLNLAEVYTLHSMYKNVSRLAYNKYDSDNNYTRFDNTIRSSKLEGDESKTNIFIFVPNDYYNVPTNKGIIINLNAIGDYILVHTEDSMFRFTGSNSFNTSDGEVQTSESEPFNTGIKEVFGSENGYGGIRKKSESMISENGYIFYDRDSKMMYNFKGDEKLDIISNSISKLFYHDEITNVSFANDYYNNRFFVCLNFKSNRYATLTFNTSENIKSFVSLHDFKFNKSFNTKTHCYFINNERNVIYTIDTKNYADYKTLSSIDTLYPQKVINDSTYYSIVDVIINPNIEKVKLLKSIAWSGRSLNESYPNVTTDNIKSLLVAEEEVQYRPCSFMRIYSDTCATELMNFIAQDPKDTYNSNIEQAPVSNQYAEDNINRLILPRYNQGYWSFNYFRNILNTDNIFKYKFDNKDDERRYNADLNSHIEGRYFVVRFVFDKDDFKLENLISNLQDKQFS